MLIGNSRTVMTKIRPRTFFDIEVGGLPMGRIVFELYSDICPETCENFRALCAGDKGLGKTTGKPLHYKGIVFHRVVKDFMIQGGDFSVGNGTGGESIYGGTFADENFSVTHDKPFLLSMANRGKDSNGSQFFITTQPAPHLDNVHVVFGEVVSGQEIVSHIEGLPVDRMSRPLQDAKVVNCGELVLKIKGKVKKREIKSTVGSHSSSSGASSSSESNSHVGKSRKKKKSKKSSKKRARSEEGEIPDSGDEDAGKPHPLVSVTKIDPDEIPEVPANKFLYRAGSANNANQKEFRQRFGRDRNRGHTKSGRIIKGRGVFRFRTPSRSRSRSMTPPHWKQAQNRTIKLHEFQKMEKERMKKEGDLDVEEGQSQIQREGERRRKFSNTRGEVQGFEQENQDLKSEVAVFRDEINQVENIENSAQVLRSHGNGNTNIEKNGNSRSRSDNRRGDGRLDKHRPSHTKTEDHRYSRRDSRDRNRKRGRSRSRDRRRSRDRDHSRRSSRDRKGRRHHSPRRRSSVRPTNRSDRHTEDRRDKRNESKRSSNVDNKDEKRSNIDRQSDKPEKSNDSLTSVMQPKFKRRSRSSSNSSRASKA
ncbi:peptidyl-prolyl cis-trans isomerase G isoform X1 [Neodiprion pinetum]|uniref:peptidylprolyl isomerase n=2 Tax=Neodiprion lecontei TaxID=441921 RepID=A0A6J0BLL0_NEOLC|nr:peptidyl-prolyl cis-trans isomerase G isoform X1 [Neodiprion lecontei]XP_046479304.1 peptidyl-prolyl cis-trans isomerase G isoform X1 [Neodiprion pinetum]XP_046479313.1 peptidyl-prolyl cis-trans isomerase G isoform X1 [Neodiprion pinetum]XP_046595747.1 peptidyl-prolyl cis-trans isomerase G isoform X1 [Neodiprion lecontei]